MKVGRKPFGVPGPPCQHYTLNFGCLVPNKKRNEAEAKRHALAMKACRLIAADRKAVRG